MSNACCQWYWIAIELLCCYLITSTCANPTDSLSAEQLTYISNAKLANFDLCQSNIVNSFFHFSFSQWKKVFFLCWIKSSESAKKNALTNLWANHNDFINMAGILCVRMHVLVYRILNKTIKIDSNPIATFRIESNAERNINERI